MSAHVSNVPVTVINRWRLSRRMRRKNNRKHVFTKRQLVKVYGVYCRLVASCMKSPKKLAAAARKRAIKQRRELRATQRSKGGVSE